MLNQDSHLYYVRRCERMIKDRENQRDSEQEEIELEKIRLKEQRRDRSSSE